VREATSDQYLTGIVHKQRIGNLVKKEQKGWIRRALLPQVGSFRALSQPRSHSALVVPERNWQAHSGCHVLA